MKTFVRAALLALLVIAATSPVLGQGFVSLVDLGAAQLQVSARVGYQILGGSFSVAIPGRDLSGRRIDLEPLDLSIKRAGLWVGRVGLDMAVGPFSLFLNAEGNPTRRADVKTTLPNFFEPYPAFVDMAASNLQWWLIDGGVAWRTPRGFGVIGGLKVDQLSTQLGSALVELPSGNRIIRDYWTGDILMKMWIPYAGVQLFGTNYKCNFLVSPFSWNDVTVPFTLDSVRTGVGAALPFTPFQLGESQYAQKTTGLFLEGDFCYSVNMLGSGTFGLWFNGRWARFANSGSQDVLAYRYVAPGIGYANDSGSGDTVFSRYSYSGGIIAEFTF